MVSSHKVYNPLEKEGHLCIEVEDFSPVGSG